MVRAGRISGGRRRQRHDEKINAERRSQRTREEQERCAATTATMTTTTTPTRLFCLLRKCWGDCRRRPARGRSVSCISVNHNRGIITELVPVDTQSCRHFTGKLACSGGGVYKLQPTLQVRYADRCELNATANQPASHYVEKRSCSGQVETASPLSYSKVYKST